MPQGHLTSLSWSWNGYYRHLFVESDVKPSHPSTHPSYCIFYSQTNEWGCVGVAFYSAKTSTIVGWVKSPWNKQQVWIIKLNVVQMKAKGEVELRGQLAMLSLLCLLSFPSQHLSFLLLLGLPLFSGLIEERTWHQSQEGPALISASATQNCEHMNPSGSF